MRGSASASGALFSYVDMEARVPATHALRRQHPLRTIRIIVNEVLAATRYRVRGVWPSPANMQGGRTTLR